MAAETKAQSSAHEACKAPTGETVAPAGLYKKLRTIGLATVLLAGVLRELRLALWARGHQETCTDLR